MWKKIALGIAALILVFVAVAAVQPKDFQIMRSVTIDAPASLVFPLVNNLQAWDKWSPFLDLDPNMKRVTEGPGQGIGASQSWVSDKAGEGKMTIVQSETDRLIALNTEFFKPWKATNRTEFTFESVGNSTKVTWAMLGERNFFMKAFGLVCNMDKMLGADFEKGLGRMKALAETAAKAQ
ncbi:SRPBCC family protein [bacterium]|nr:SRPBCC family protein [bacterium]